MGMIQTPLPGEFLLKWRGDTLRVELKVEGSRKGRAAFRTNIGYANVRRDEIINETERGEAPLNRAWNDIALEEIESGVFAADIVLDEVGIFSGKACFFPEGGRVPEWPDGSNVHIKVESGEARKNNSIYTVFPRQFGSFREVTRRLDFIMGKMRFRIIQTLPPFPVPTSYAVMGEYGCPFAATDFLSVDPAMAEFDEYATPLDQFRELIDAVHSRRGLFFVDLPANHTGWASTLQIHHPDWFHRETDGKFVSPGAWGVKWADLVELDYSNPQLRSYIADVFLFWCRNGVDGFRCDAGYMIPLKTWEYIVARVRKEFPDTVFMLEGLGGDLRLTDSLLAEANLDWAYSEIFQTYDRRQFEWYLPQAIARSEKFGTLVHFAETHDNNRLANGGEVYARLRVMLAAMLSWQGAWGIANGVEWYCREKIDVHGKNGLNWGSESNMVELIARLNGILANHIEFVGASHLEIITRGSGNTLAIKRGRLLILANLDCGGAVDIDFNRNGLDATQGKDLITGRHVDVSAKVSLSPGELLCVDLASTEERNGLLEVNHEMPAQEAMVHWRYPRDTKREVVIPAGKVMEVAASRHFRAMLVDPTSGRTLCASLSHSRADENFAYFTAPTYEGDGTRCKKLELRMVVYEEESSRRVSSPILVPPQSDKARVKLMMSGDEVRHHPNYRTILSNGAGAVSQVRIGWGEIDSQYDALLAANPNPMVPSDRINLWARTRCWLQNNGYTREFDAKCISRFTADPSGKGARWEFSVPCGMGKIAAFAFELTLAVDKNGARLRVTRYASGKDDVVDSLRIVMRPDVEWRSFHATTKAYQGQEALFSRSCETRATGFMFAPYDGKFSIKVKNGEYHHDPQWSYNVAHPEEAARGQDGAGDLFSPGWISADLRVDETVELIGVYGSDFGLKWGIDNFAAVSYLPIDEALKKAMELYVVRRDNLKTVIAGYPWFLDWGRDTFIFMRGMIAAGMLADAVKILKAFAAFEDRGTLPNIIYGKTAGNRDTTDAQLWFIRCVEEAEKAMGKKLNGLRETCRSIVDNYIKGTPNGIHVDPESALVWSPSHFTWMDTNYPACTPRVGYPVEIEALWISALRFTGRHELEEQAIASVKRLFKCENGYRDCLAAPNGESASQAIPEDTIRPNQLLLITLDVLDDKSILSATEELLVPGGIRSLNADHPAYRGVYAGDEDSSRKPAYHNGTVWAWQFPMYAEALFKTRSCQREVALEMLASSVENLNSGCFGHISEIADGDAPHIQRGCTAQAWSDSETLRVWLSLTR